MLTNRRTNNRATVLLARRTGTTQAKTNVLPLFSELTFWRTPANFRSVLLAIGKRTDHHPSGAQHSRCLLHKLSSALLHALSVQHLLCGLALLWVQCCTKLCVAQLSLTLHARSLQKLIMLLPLLPQLLPSLILSPLIFLLVLHHNFHTLHSSILPHSTIHPM